MFLKMIAQVGEEGNTKQLAHGFGFLRLIDLQGEGGRRADEDPRAKN